MYEYALPFSLTHKLTMANTSPSCLYNFSEQTQSNFYFVENYVTACLLISVLWLGATKSIHIYTLYSSPT